MAVTELAPVPLMIADLRPEDLADPAVGEPFAPLSDAELSDAVALVISRPKAAEADSFVLHAPLELLARSALLSLVEPDRRDLARRRMLWLGATYAAAGPGADPDEAPDGPTPSAGSPATVLAELEAAVDRGEVDRADAAVSALAAALPPDGIGAALTDLVVPRLSAAAHGNIFLFQLPRIAPRSRAAGVMARGLVRELARHPEWNLTWHLDRPAATDHDRGARAADHADQLIDALLRPRSPGPLDSNFIFPTMSLVERSGLAAELLEEPTREIGLRSARRALLRVAAWSMLQDDPDQAPYGWTHCLTLPQAALGIAHAAHDPADAIAVAATYVLGFRATQGRVRLDPEWAPDPLDGPRGAEGGAGGLEALDALGGRPDEAAAAAWHAPARLGPTVVARLAGYAAMHPDAHLAKYTVACLDAASADPDAAHVYLAASAFLGAWWRQLPSDDPLMA
ncbi:MAG: hypothetical protein ACXWBN_05305 [Acidimicrobiales bacterium]